MTRIVILLATPAGHLSAYFPSRRTASDFIREWYDVQVKLLTGALKEDEIPVTNRMLCGKDVDGIVWAVIAKCVVGMYIPTEAPTAHDRIADVLEKQVDAGEGWKG